MRLTILFLLAALNCNAQFSVKFGMSYNGSPVDRIYEDIITDAPELFLTDTLYAMSGVNYFICGDAVGIEKVGESRIIYDYICSVGTESGNNYTINQTVSVPTYYQFTIQAKYSQYGIVRTIESKSAVLCILPAYAVQDTINVLFCGNSLTDAGSATYLPYIDTLLLNTATFSGTKGTNPYKHEGTPGYTFWSYIYNSANPFWNGSASNLKYYRNKNHIGLVDYAFIQLGINDILANTVDTAAIRGAQMTRVKALVDLFLADDSISNVIICLEPKCESLTLTNYFTVGWDLYKTATGYAYDENYYIKKMHFLWNLIYDTYGHNNYSSRVFVLPVGINIDRASGYNYNALHPIAYGYRQMGKSYAAYLNYLLLR